MKSDQDWSDLELMSCLYFYALPLEADSFVTNRSRHSEVMTDSKDETASFEQPGCGTGLSAMGGYGTDCMQACRG